MYHIKAYVVSELKQTFLLNNPEVRISEYILDTTGIDNTVDTYRKVTAHMLMNHEQVTDTERKLLTLYYFDGLTTRKIGKLLDTSHTEISKKLKNIRNKLKRISTIWHQTA